MLTLLHSERPKLHRVFAILSAIGLMWLCFSFVLFLSLFFFLPQSKRAFVTSCVLSEQQSLFERGLGGGGGAYSERNKYPVCIFFSASVEPH